MNTEVQMRAEFEAWVSEPSALPPREYKFGFKVWQAACAQKTVTPIISDAHADTIMENMFKHIAAYDAKGDGKVSEIQVSGEALRFILNAVKELK